MHGKDVDITRYLLLKGADPNYQIEYSVPPIKLLVGDWCSSEVACELVVFLLAYGAKISYGETKDKQGLTPLEQLESLRPWVDYTTYTPRFVLDNEPALKKDYLTHIVNKLLQEKQHQPLDPLFVDYIEESGVTKNLVDQLKNRL